MYINKVINFLKFFFYISVILLVIVSLYPGSLIGFLLYNDLSQQPYFIKNPYGTAINHLIGYFMVSLLGFSLYLRSEHFKKLVLAAAFLSIILELLQFIIPHRTFEFIDLIGNILGVIIAYSLLKIYLLFNKI